MREPRRLPSYPEAPRPGLVTPVRLDPTGVTGPTPNEARGPHWRRTSQGFHVPVDVAGDTPEQRILEAAVVVPEVAGLTGWAALRWCGAPWFDGIAEGATRPVTIVTADANVRSQPGIVISQERLNPAELFLHDTIALTIPVRSACFEARYAPSLYAATEVWDMAAFSDLVSLNEARAYADAHPGWTGIPQARTSLALADENSWSPQETWLRLVWSSRQDCRVRAATFRSSTTPATSSGPRICSTRCAVSSASTTGRCTSREHSERVTWSGKRRSAGTGWSTSRSSPRTCISPVGQPTGSGRRTSEPVRYQRRTAAGP